MAIQPAFAQAILDGSKQVEFRKRRLAADIDTVLIYESSPTKRIVGHFTIERTELATPRGLWRSFGAVGSIARADYLTYYGNSERAVGLVISRVERYKHPVALAELSSRPAVPQSFSYLPASALTEVQSLQEADPAWIDRIFDLATNPLRQFAQLCGRGTSTISTLASQR
jgi:predicted transcriptional regulator